MKEKVYDQTRYYQPGVTHYRATAQNFVMCKDGVLRDVPKKDEDKPEFKLKAK